MKRWRYVLVTLLGLALAPGARAQTPTPPAPPAGVDNARDRLRGTYVLLDGDRAVATRNAAIEQAIDGMFFAAKPIARHALQERSGIDAAITLRIEEGVVRAATPENAPVVSRDDGSWSTYSHRDEVYRLAQRITPAGLVQQFIGADGSRRNDFTLSEDGRVLTLHVTIAGRQLPRPLSYTLRYKRVVDQPLDL